MDTTEKLELHPKIQERIDELIKRIKTIQSYNDNFVKIVSIFKDNPNIKIDCESWGIIIRLFSVIDIKEVTDVLKLLRKVGYKRLQIPLEKNEMANVITYNFKNRIELKAYFAKSNCHFEVVGYKDKKEPIYKFICK